MPKIRSALIAASLLCGLGGAQAQSPSPPANPPAVDAASPFVPANKDDLLASNLIDLAVTDQGGAKIGEIEDVVLGPDRTMRAIVVGVGGYRGGNVRHVAVAPSALQVSRNEAGKWRAVLPLGADQLNAAPAFPYKSGFNDD